MAHCEKHNIDYEPQERTIGSFTLKIGCPECQREHDEELEREDIEARQRDNIAAFEAMNIEPLFYDATFDSFIDSTPELKRAKEVVQKLVEGEIQQIVMSGRNGTGKTHLAVAALKEKGGKIFSMYEIATRIRATYTARADEDELQVVDELARLPLLVIDEMGRTKGSDAETNWLSYIIDKRHSRGLPTILISNKHVRKYCPVDKKAGCKDCLENYLDNDVMSRINEGGILLQFTGEDWRKKGGAK